MLTLRTPGLLTSKNPNQRLSFAVCSVRGYSTSAQSMTTELTDDCVGNEKIRSVLFPTDNAEKEYCLELFFDHIG